MCHCNGFICMQITININIPFAIYNINIYQPSSLSFCSSRFFLNIQLFNITHINE